MSIIRKVQLSDGNGNYFESHQDIDGEYYLASAIIQAIHADPNNSNNSDDPSNGGINLTSENSYTFIGTATSTLGVAGLQWNLKTDQNAIVYIEQSPDGINWDVSDSFVYYHGQGGNGGTVQAINAYWRIRVVLTTTTDTTYFRLNGILCPIVEALPRSLDYYGRLKGSNNLVDAETGIRADIEPLGSLKTIIPTRLIGTGFDGTTLDPNFWTSNVTGTGSVTQSGGLIVATGTTADSTATVQSVRRARKVPGAVNQFRAVARLGTDIQANNLRRLGAYDVNDGLFFQVNGTSFGVGSRKGTSDTIVNSGSFNGNYGSSVTMDTSLKRLVIDYSAMSAKFYVNGILLHTITNDTATFTNTLTLPIKMENINSGGNDTNNNFNIRFATILRLGQLYTNPTYKYATNGTTILKYSAGTLHRITITDNSGTLLAYDGLSAAGVLIANLDASKTVGTMEFGAPFSNGLTVVVAGTPKMTIVYE